jgi:hypothetical protein
LHSKFKNIFKISFVATSLGLTRPSSATIKWGNHYAAWALTSILTCCYCMSYWECRLALPSWCLYVAAFILCSLCLVFLGQAFLILHFNILLYWDLTYSLPPINANKTIYFKCHLKLHLKFIKCSKNIIRHSFNVKSIRKRNFWESSVWVST